MYEHVTVHMSDGVHIYVMRYTCMYVHIHTARLGGSAVETL